MGLITYMRTDSTAIAPAAQAEAREFIQEKFGANFLPPTPPIYKTKSKGAQEAHEAIRPTSAKREPAALKSYLDRDQYRLYDLIWKRFIASQMAPAVLDVTSVDVAATVGQVGNLSYARYLFRATGSIIKFPGFLAVYEEAREEGEAPSEDEEGKGVRLPPLAVNEPLDLLKLIPEQHFTQPPPRYTEASLVKALEEYGIGRPSTYAPILTTIQARGYVTKNGKQLVPTELGFITNDLLVGSFAQYVDVGFTAQMEEQLDEVAEGKVKWVGMLREFYTPFIASVEHAQAAMPHVEIKPEATGQTCPECGGALVVKLGRFGKFIACSNYPELPPHRADFGQDRGQVPAVRQGPDRAADEKEARVLRLCGLQGGRSQLVQLYDVEASAPAAVSQMRRAARRGGEECGAVFKVRGARQPRRDARRSIVGLKAAARLTPGWSAWISRLQPTWLSVRSLNSGQSPRNAHGEQTYEELPKRIVVQRAEPPGVRQHHAAG